VYEAEAITPRTKRRVVVKAAVGPHMQHILEREIALLSRFSHPNLPHVIGFAVRPPRFPELGSWQRGDQTCRALVIAWSGIDLLRLLRSASAANRTLGVELAISVAVQLLDAIAAIDRAGMVHTEVRPDHITVAEDGTVTLIDFGYVKADLPRPNDLISPGRRIDRFRFRHMSPEQVLGREIDHYTDVFSAAGVISQLVANEHPVPLGQSDFETLDLVRRTRQVASIDLPDALRVPLQRALDPDNTRRPTAAELRAALLDGARRIRMDIGPHVLAQQLVELGVPT
jgi:serine/threonine protein kinase